MQIIRIEHPSNGRGIFTNSHLIDIKYRDSEWYYRHNSMDSARFIDGFESGKHFCAYKSIDELQLWLTSDELRLIISKGFIVYLLEVSDYIVHTDQVIFTKESISEQKDISELFA